MTLAPAQALLSQRAAQPAQLLALSDIHFIFPLGWKEGHVLPCTQDSYIPIYICLAPSASNPYIGMYRSAHPMEWGSHTLYSLCLPFYTMDRLSTDARQGYHHTIIIGKKKNSKKGERKEPNCPTKAAWIVITRQIHVQW